MPIPTAPAPLRAVLDLIVARTLRRPASLFAGARRVWALPVLEELHALIVARYDAPAETFDERWAAQLEGAGEGAVQLAGELMYTHVVVASDLRGSTKRGLVERTLARSPRPARVPEVLDAVLDTGLCRTGIAFKARRGAQLRCLLETALAWRSEDAPTRRTLLAEPSPFKAWLHALPHDGAQAQRELLLHVVHPAAFEPIASPGLKARLVTAHADVVPRDVTDVDEALQWVRRAAEEEHGDGVALTDARIAGATDLTRLRVPPGPSPAGGSTAGAGAPPAGRATRRPARAS